MTQKHKPSSSTQACAREIRAPRPPACSFTPDLLSLCYEHAARLRACAHHVPAPGPPQGRPSARCQCARLTASALLRALPCRPCRHQSDLAAHQALVSSSERGLKLSACSRVSAGARPRASTSGCSRRHPPALLGQGLARSRRSDLSLRLRLEEPARHRRWLGEAATRAPNAPGSGAEGPGLAGGWAPLPLQGGADAERSRHSGERGRAGLGCRKQTKNTAAGPRGLDSQTGETGNLRPEAGGGGPQRRLRCQTLRNSGTAPPARPVLRPADVACGHAKARPGARQEGPPADPPHPPFLPALA